MSNIPLWLLVVGAMLILGVGAAKVSYRLGVPALLAFLLVGMLAGKEGFLQYDFSDYRAANDIASTALALILFEGGMSTPRRSIRLVWRPALALATVGVLATAALTGVAACWILGLSLMEGMLLGSIVGSTDASAVFTVLRSGGIRLPKRLAATLEVESGSNDPMAIFLTLGCLTLLGDPSPSLLGLGTMFLKQAGIGTLVGLAGGFAATLTINRIKLNAPGLYPVLALGFGLTTFGLASVLGGSGFLAVYLAGAVIGNRKLVDRRGILRFHDAAAWMSQIVMFVMLGLLCVPSRLMAAAPEGLAVAATLMFLARPLAVAPILALFRYRWKEIVYASWVGLKGAVPITLATFPLLYGVPRAVALFDVVFFAVVVTALVQGLSISPFARVLGLDRPLSPTPTELRRPAPPTEPPVE